MPDLLAPPQLPQLVEHDGWLVRQGVPVFDEHEARDGTQYNRDLLERIAQNCNSRSQATGDYCPLIVGHTTPGGKEQPIVGLAKDFRVGEHAGKYSIVADFWFHEHERETAEKYLRRSVEVWNKNPEDRFFDPIALLGGSTPKRDLGLGAPLGTYSRAAMDALVIVERYEMAMPGAANTFLPSHGKKPREQYDCGPEGNDPCEPEDKPANSQPDNKTLAQGGNLTPEDIAQLIQAFEPWLEAEIEKRTRPVDDGEPTLEDGDFGLAEDGADPMADPMGGVGDSMGGPMADPMADPMGGGMGDDLPALPAGVGNEPPPGPGGDGGPMGQLGLDQPINELPGQDGDPSGMSAPPQLPPTDGNNDPTQASEPLPELPPTLPNDPDDKKPQRFSRASEDNNPMATPPITRETLEHYAKSANDNHDLYVRERDAHTETQDKYQRLQLDNRELQDRYALVEKERDELRQTATSATRETELRGVVDRYALVLGEDGIKGEMDKWGGADDRMWKSHLDTMAEHYTRVPIDQSLPTTENEADRHKAAVQGDRERNDADKGEQYQKDIAQRAGKRVLDARAEGRNLDYGTALREVKAAA